MKYTEKTRKELVEEIESLKIQLKAIQDSGAGHECPDVPLDIETQHIISVFDSIGESVYVSDPETYEILYVNRVTRKMYGDVVGKKCYRAFQNKDAPCSFCTNKYIFGNDARKTHIWEFQNRVTKHWYKCIDRAIWWPDGRRVRYEMTIDITERKKVEEALRKSEKRFRELTELLPDAIVEMDSEGSITYANRAAFGFSGYSQEDVRRGLKIFQMVVPEDRRRLEVNFKKILEGEKFGPLEYTVIGKDGRRFPVLVHSNAIVDEKRKIVGIRSVAVESTVIKQAEKALKESAKALREQKGALEQKNIALREVLEQIELEKKSIRDDVAANVENLLLPNLKKLRLRGGSRKYINILRRNLEELATSFGRKISDRSMRLTPREIEICNMIRSGLTSKEISKLLNISLKTTERHRFNIRNKLGIAHKKINLTAYLQKR
jgi:PAS domain S-box-containing protein